MKLYLLKKYKKNKKGDIIEVDNDVAIILIEEGIGRCAKDRDFLIKPEMGISKAFGFSPVRK